MFDEAILQAIRIHAIAEYPNESCGVVLADGYHRLDNISPEPTKAFECTEQLAPLLAEGVILALVHSHPDGPDAPTAYDMSQQTAMDVPWGILSCNHETALPAFFWHDDFEPPPLLGRGFRYGPSGTDGRGDCAALVRDYYRIERNIRLKEFPRQDFWWLVPGVSYEANLLETGFVAADPRQLEPGDVFIAQIRSGKNNHAGIFLGNGLILHHLTNRLSREDSAISWQRCITGWYRYVG